MNGVLELKVPIKVNGEEITKLEYDTDDIDGDIFIDMESQHRKACGYSNMAIAEVDAGLHLYMGYGAIIAKNRAIDVNDLKRIKGTDVPKIMRIGRSFINPPAI